MVASLLFMARPVTLLPISGRRPCTRVSVQHSATTVVAMQRFLPSGAFLTQPCIRVVNRRVGFIHAVAVPSRMIRAVRRLCACWDRSASANGRAVHINLCNRLMPSSLHRHLIDFLGARGDNIRPSVSEARSLLPTRSFFEFIFRRIFSAFMRSR